MRSLSNLYVTYVCRITFTRVSHIIRYNGTMSNAYLRYEEGSDRFNFSFNLEYKHVNRQFNFNRSISETVGDFVSRISTNISKALEKRKGKCGVSQIENDRLVKLLRDGAPLPSDTKSGAIIRETGLQLIVSDKLYEIVVNPPWVHSLVLPDSILAGFPVYPSKIELEFADRDLSSFIWFRSADDKRNHFSWSPIGEGFFYTPTYNEIGSRLKLVCTPRTKVRPDEETYREGPKTEAISPTVVEAGPGVCPFEARHGFTSERVQEGRFRVVSYNILADTYADSDFSRNVLYPYCPPYALAVNYRKQLLLKELIGYNADLMCLQEVDAKVFEFDLTTVLSSLGYEGLFQRKGKVNEGLACFFHKRKFKLVLSSSILLGKEISSNPIFSEIYEHILTSCPEPSKFLAQVCDLPTTLQVTVLEVIEKGMALGKRVVVATTHLYFHPLADNIRLLQTGMCLRYLEHMVDQLSKDSQGKISLLFCGDFNSTPEFGVLRLITSGKVSEDDPDWSSCKGIDNTSKADAEGENEVEDDAAEHLITIGMNLSHSFSLSSAYGQVPFTNYTSGFAGCLDYIFYSMDALTVEQVVPLPSEEEVAQNVAIPSIVFPSDHIAIVADLRWNSC